MSARAIDLAHRRALLPAAVVALACASIAVRPVSYRSLAATLAVGALGFLAPGRDPAGVSRARWVAAVGLGTAAFLAGRALGAPIGITFTTLGVVSICVAAVAEEMFFRRYLWSLVAPRGPLAAIAVTSALFAVVHVPLYGAGAFPIDLAAGALLGWQRWAAGTWTAPAVTHVIANLLQMG